MAKNLNNKTIYDIANALYNIVVFESPHLKNNATIVGLANLLAYLMSSAKSWSFRRYSVPVLDGVECLSLAWGSLLYTNTSKNNSEVSTHSCFTLDRTSNEDAIHSRCKYYFVCCVPVQL